MVNRAKLPDTSGPDIRPIYHDENLSQNFGPRRISQLRRIPVRERQNVMTEVAQRLRSQPDTPIDDLISQVMEEQGW